MKVVVAAVLCVLSLSAFAGEKYGREGGVNINLRNDPRAKSESTAFSSAIGEGGNAVAYGGSGGNGGAGGVGIGGNGGAGGVGIGGGGGEANSGGNTLSVNEVHPDKITIRQVPSFGVAAISPTANCMGAASATLATGFFGIGGGKSYLNKHCVYQELARFYATAGDMAVANEILCQSEYMRGVSICRGR